MYFLIQYEFAIKICRTFIFGGYFQHDLHCLWTDSSIVAKYSPQISILPLVPSKYIFFINEKEMEIESRTSNLKKMLTNNQLITFNQFILNLSCIFIPLHKSWVYPTEECKRFSIGDLLLKIDCFNVSILNCFWIN